MFRSILSILGLTGVIAGANPVFAVEKAPSMSSCSRAQEYITATEFLRGKQEWAIPSAEVRKVARRVAFHCPGSAARLVQVTSVLVGAGITPRDALTTGLRYSEKSDAVTTRFLALFKKLYLEDEFDLDLVTSHQVADELSAQFQGSLPEVEKEFVRFADFCASSSGLNQSRPNCARFASEVLLISQNQTSGVSERWLKLFEFLTSTSGVNLTTGAAAALATEVMKSGEAGPESFIHAYRYAHSRQGLALERGPSLAFSKDLVLSDLASASAPSALPQKTRSRNSADALKQPQPKDSIAVRAPAQQRSTKSE